MAYTDRFGKFPTAEDCEDYLGEWATMFDQLPPSARKIADDRRDSSSGIGKHPVHGMFILGGIGEFIWTAWEAKAKRQRRANPSKQPVKLSKKIPLMAGELFDVERIAQENRKNGRDQLFYLRSILSGTSVCELYTALASAYTLLDQWVPGKGRDRYTIIGREFDVQNLKVFAQEVQKALERRVGHLFLGAAQEEEKKGKK